MTYTTSPRPVDIPSLFPELVPYRLGAVRLHPRRGTPDARRSSVGGPLLWPASEPWPHCDHVHPDGGFRPPPPGPTPMVPVLQLYATDIPDLPFVPGTDLLQLLWCPFGHEPYHSPRPLLRWRATGAVGSLLNRPPRSERAPKEYVPKPCVLHPERISEYPSWDLPNDLAVGLSDRFKRLKEESGWSYQYELSVAPGVKVAGYPNWTQEPNWPNCPQCDTRMDHLLTIDSTEFDGGSARAWLPTEDRQAAGSIFKLPLEERRLIQNPHGLMIGDMGGVYLFICPRCPNRPYAYRSDCS
jgi:hypothetical protein